MISSLEHKLADLDKRLTYLETHVDIIQVEGEDESRKHAIPSGMPMGPTDTNNTLLNG